jgi:hypothetical protein
MQLSVDIEPAKRGEPVRVTADGVEMVIVRADVYDRVTRILEADEINPRDAYSAILRAWDQDDNPADYEVYRQS